MAAAIIPSSPGFTRREKRLLFLVWSLFLVFGAQIASLVPFVEQIRADLSLSKGQMGLVLGAWQIVYIIGAAYMGQIGDRLGAHRALCFGMACLCGSALLRSVAPDFGTMLAAVALFGLGGPIISVGIPRLLSRWFRGKKLGLASGIFMTGAALGSSISLMGSVPLADALGGSWRTIMLVQAGAAGAVGVVWLIFGLGEPDGDAGRGHMRGSGGYLHWLMSSRAIVPALFIGWTSFLISHGLRSWLPVVLASRGMELQDANLLVGVQSLCGVVGSLVLVRWLAENPRRDTLVCLLCLITALGALCTTLPAGLVSAAAVLIVGFTSTAMTPIMLNVLMAARALDPRDLSRALSLYFALGQTGGTLAPWMMGVLADRTGNFFGGIVLMSLAVAIGAIVAFRLPPPRPEEVLPPEHVREVHSLE